MPGECTGASRTVGGCDSRCRNPATARRRPCSSTASCPISRAWHRVTAELEEHGFRVLAVDLAGHGRSPRARTLLAEAWADDVVETLEPLLDGPPDVVMGHSLGGLVASLVADRLAPRAAIYIDPAFAFPSRHQGLGLQGVLRDRAPPAALGAGAHEPEVERRRRRHRARDAARLGQAHDPRLRSTPSRSCRRCGSSRRASSCSPRRASSSPSASPRSCAAGA